MNFLQSEYTSLLVKVQLDKGTASLCKYRERNTTRLTPDSLESLHTAAKISGMKSLKPEYSIKIYTHGKGHIVQEAKFIIERQKHRYTCLTRDNMIFHDQVSLFITFFWIKNKAFRLEFEMRTPPTQNLIKLLMMGLYFGDCQTV